MEVEENWGFGKDVPKAKWQPARTRRWWSTMEGILYHLPLCQTIDPSFEASLQWMCVYMVGTDPRLHLWSLKPASGFSASYHLLAQRRHKAMNIRLLQHKQTWHEHSLPQYRFPIVSFAHENCIMESRLLASHLFTPQHLLLSVSSYLQTHQ